MGLMSNLFKPKAQSDAEADASARTLQRLKAHRGEETGKWLSLMLDKPVPQPPGPPPTVEDVDRTEKIDEAPYSPPIEARYAAPAGGPPPTIEDIDRLETLDEAPYSPPIEALYASPSGDQSRAPLDAAPSTQPSQSELVPHQENETVTWVNQLFSEFTRQVTEYNATVSSAHVAITVRPPIFTYESPSLEDAGDSQRRVSVFKGHIATLHWAMLVQGYDGKVDVYVMAADEILNFTLNDIRKSSLSPFMEITSSNVGGHLEWSIGGAKIGAQAIPLLAKELVGDLIRISTGTMNESELFADHSTGLKLGETVASGYAPSAEPAPQASNVPPSATTSLESLATWTACDALLNALQQDLSWITSRAGAIDPTGNQAEAQRLHDLSARLRTLSGQLSQFIAENHPNAGSKYNAS